MVFGTLAVYPLLPVLSLTVVQEFYSHSGMDLECFICIPVIMVTEYNFFFKKDTVLLLSSFVSLLQDF